MLRKITILSLTTLGLSMIVILALKFESPHRSQLTTSSKLPISEKLKSLLYYGSLAPSSHNAQMWKVGIRSESELVLSVDEKRQLPAVDPAQREALLSLGAFIENIAQAASSLGYEVQVDYPRSNSENEIALLRLKDSSVKSSSGSKSLEAIQARHTIKKPFLLDALRQEDLHKLIGNAPGSITYYPLDSSQGQYIKNGIIESMKVQVKNNAKQEEMAAWTRLNKSDAERTKDGVTAEMMGITGIKKLFFNTFLTQSSLISDSYRQQTVDSITQQAGNAAGYFVITSEDDSQENLLQTGRIYERLLLAATEHEVAIHTMSSMLEEEPWKSELAQKLGISGTPQFILRAGYVEDMGKPTSLRRSIDDFAFMVQE